MELSIGEGEELGDSPAWVRSRGRGKIKKKGKFRVKSGGFD